MTLVHNSGFHWFSRIPILGDAGRSIGERCHIKLSLISRPSTPIMSGAQGNFLDSILSSTIYEFLYRCFFIYHRRQPRNIFV